MAVDPEALTEAMAKQKAQQRQLAEKWLKEIKRIRDKEDKWRKKAQDVLDRYRDDRGFDDNLSKFNILWANTEVIKPAIFSRMPVPDVRRRYLTQDPAARTAAMILERALSYSISTYNFKDTCDRVLEDYVLPGRAQCFVCYEPLILNKAVRTPAQPLPPSDTEHNEEEDSEVPSADPHYPPDTQFEGDQAFHVEQQEYKAWESVYAKYVPWKLFGFSECTQWQDCKAVWIGEYMTKDAIRTAFPSFRDLDNLTIADEKSSSSSSDLETRHDQPPATLCIWKVWHKETRTYLVLAEGYTEGPLMVQEDPTQLEGFFPFPEPLYSLRNNHTWMPKPEFLMYQDQANELDIVVNRLRNLINALKVRGVYDKAMDELAKISELYKAPDLTFFPIPDFRNLTEKGGLEHLVDTLPLEEIVAAVAQLREREQELKQQIYEIYGVADIMRGATEASETLGAQQLKAQYGGLRVSIRQERMQTFVRDVLRIKAELIAEHFDPDTLRLMTGIQVIDEATFQQMQQAQQVPAGAIAQSEFDQAIQILKDDKLRGFKVDIETDSTIPVDRQQDQQNRIAFISAIGQYLTGIIPAVQQGAIPMKVAREGLLFVVRGFKVGSELEEVLEEMGQDSADTGQQLSQLQQVNQQLQQQVQQLQAELQQATSKQAENEARAQADIQVDTAKAHNKIVTDTAKAQNTMALDAAQTHHGMTLQTVQTLAKPAPGSVQ